LLKKFYIGDPLGRKWENVFFLAIASIVGQKPGLQPVKGSVEKPILSGIRPDLQLSHGGVFVSGSGRIRFVKSPSRAGH